MRETRNEKKKMNFEGVFLPLPLGQSRQELNYVLRRLKQTFEQLMRTHRRERERENMNMCTE